MSKPYLVSVATDKDFHAWCRATGNEPETDATWVPTVPLTKRAAALEGKSVFNETQLIGEFSNEERQELIKLQVAPSKGKVPEATKE